MTKAATTGDLIRKKACGVGAAIRFEWGIAILLTIAAIVFHIRYFLSAGALWRDEITSVNLASAHSLGYAVANMHNDSFPVLWLCIVRLWVKSGIGASDVGMRILGLVAGVAILGALWRNARRFGANTPVVSIALLTFTSAVICFGDSVRAYGLGMFLGLCAIGAIWDLAQRPSRWRFVIALIVALLSVHMLFYNCILLFAACCGGAAVALLKGQTKRTMLVLSVGLICAISMLVYVPMIRHTRGEKMFQINLSSAWIWAQLRASLRFATDGDVHAGHNDLIWGAVVVMALLMAMGAWGAGMLKSGSQRRRDAVVFCGTCLVVGVFGYWGFLKVLRYTMQPWYFLAAMALGATCLDGLFSVIQLPPLRVLLAAYAAGFSFYSGISVWQNVGVRRTNADIVADEAAKMAAKGDLIAIAPWYMGVSFERYYHGEAECVTIPPVSFMEYQEYDLLTRYMREERAMGPVIERLAAVLEGGHRVWVVSSDALVDIPPTDFFQAVPDAGTGWRSGDYESSWDQQVLYALRRDSKSFLMIDVPKDRPVSEYERLWFCRVEGWRGNSHGAGRENNIGGGK
jgi:hypothetical protein